jgi:hypothetical protein
MPEGMVESLLPEHIGSQYAGSLSWLYPSNRFQELHYATITITVDTDSRRVVLTALVLTQQIEQPYERFRSDLQHEHTSRHFLRWQCPQRQSTRIHRRWTNTLKHLQRWPQQLAQAVSTRFHGYRYSAGRLGQTLKISLIAAPPSEANTSTERERLTRSGPNDALRTVPNGKDASMSSKREKEQRKQIQADLRTQRDIIGSGHSTNNFTSRTRADLNFKRRQS